MPFLLVWAIMGAPLTAQVQDGLRLMTPDGHVDQVWSVIFSPDGRWVLTAGADGTARLWETATGREVRRLAGHDPGGFDGGAYGAVNTAAFSPDGRSVVTAGDDGTARIWNLATGAEVTRYSGHVHLGSGDRVTSAVFSPDGRTVLTASWDRTAVVWDASTGLELVRFAGEAYLNWAEFSPDGRTAITSGHDRTARLWEVATGREVGRFNARGKVSSAGFSPDGRMVVTAGQTVVQVWDVATGRELWHAIGAVNVAAFSPDGRAVVTAGRDGTVWVVDATTGRELTRLVHGSSGLTSVAYSPDGRLLAAAGSDGIVRTWEAATGRAHQQLSGHSTWAASAHFSPDGREIVMVGGDRVVRVWDASSGREIQQLVGHDSMVTGAVFSPEGRRVVTAGLDRTARVWDVASGREVQRFIGHEGLIRAIAFRPDGQALVTAGWDRTSRIWDVASGRELRRLADPGGMVSVVAFSPDGRLVLTASEDERARLWDPASGQEVARLEGHRYSVTAAEFSPDGEKVVTAGFDGTLRLWNAATGAELGRFQGPDEFGSPLTSVAFSRDGRRVVAGSEDGTVRIWDVASRSEVQRLTGHTGQVWSTAFSPDLRVVVSTSQDHTVRAWDVESGQELFRRIVIDSNDWIAVAPDGRFDGSDAGITRIHYARGLTTIGLDAFFLNFYTPGLTGQILSGAPYDGPDIRQGFGLPPAVEILSPVGGDTVGATVTVAIAVTDRGGGAEGVQLFRNGSSIDGDLRGLGRAGTECPARAVCFQVELLPGENRLEATAFSSAQIEAERARVSVFVRGTPPRSSLHILAVGINTYQNPQYSVNYARPDARAFVDTVVAGAQGIFDQILVDTLFDQAATGLGIKAAFLRIAARAQPQDVFVFFYAGHGIADQVGDSVRFYLVPTDVTQITPEQLAQRAVPNLFDLLGRVRAEKKVALIDACQSGRAVQEFAGRGLAEQQAIARLAKAKGVFVMSAAGSDQLATELGALGHGVFTYAWLQAMAGDPAGPRERLVGALASEVERVIPELSRRYRSQPQYPIVFRNGQDFPLVVR